VLRTTYPRNSPDLTLPVMAGGDCHSKHPHAWGSHCDVSPLSTHQARIDVSPSWVSSVFRWVLNPRHCTSGFACFVVMLNPTRRLIQGSLRSNNRVGGDYKTAGATLGVGEGAVRAGERPFSQRARRGGGRAGAHGMRHYL
jgi:hypothetical protein